MGSLKTSTKRDWGRLGTSAKCERWITGMIFLLFPSFPASPLVLMSSTLKSESLGEEANETGTTQTALVCLQNSAELNLFTTDTISDRILRKLQRDYRNGEVFNKGTWVIICCCRKVAVTMLWRFSTLSICIQRMPVDPKSGQEEMTVVEKLLLCGSFQKNINCIKIQQLLTLKVDKSISVQISFSHHFTDFFLGQFLPQTCHHISKFDWAVRTSKELLLLETQSISLSTAHFYVHFRTELLKAGLSC